MKAGSMGRRTDESSRIDRERSGLFEQLAFRAVNEKEISVQKEQSYYICPTKMWFIIVISGRGATGVGEYKAITICGSTRFKDAFMEAQKRLTLESNVVISVGLFGHSGDKEVWDGMDESTLSRTKEMLDDMHTRKIDRTIRFM